MLPSHIYLEGFYKTSKQTKQQKTTSVGENEEEMDPLHTVGGKVKWYSLHGKHLRGVSWNQCPMNTKGRYIHKKIERRVLKRYLYTHTHSSIIYDSQR